MSSVMLMSNLFVANFANALYEGGALTKEEINATRFEGNISTEMCKDF